MSDGDRLPEGVDGARLSGGTAVCKDCGYSVRFDGDESYEDAETEWWSDDHQEQHFGPSTTGGDQP